MLNTIIINLVDPMNILNEKQKKITTDYVKACTIDGFINGTVLGLAVRAVPQLRIPLTLCSVGVGVYQYVKRTERFQSDVLSA